jgi:hypothetical protein
LHKILALVFNMFIYAKVGHSKFIEMHRDASDFYRSTLVTGLILWSIELFIYIQTNV